MIDSQVRWEASREPSENWKGALKCQCTHLTPKAIAQNTAIEEYNPKLPVEPVPG
ncbi:hypothetical protein QQ045_031610 [Rhodiola kirilowii]